MLGSRYWILDAGCWMFARNVILALNIQLYNNFPQNVWIATQYDQLRFLALVEEKGVEFLESEFDSLETKYQVTNPGILNDFGYTLVFENRFNEAIEVFKINIKLFPEVANGYDSLSETYALAGNNDTAIYRLLISNS